MSFHVGFCLARVVTEATEKGAIFTVHISIQVAVKVLVLSRKASYENIDSFIRVKSRMFDLHMHSVSTPARTNIVAHMALDLLVRLRHVS